MRRIIAMVPPSTRERGATMRKLTAIERAGRMERAERHVNEALVETRKAYDILIEDEPEVAAALALVLIHNEAALKLLKDV